VRIGSGAAIAGEVLCRAGKAFRESSVITGARILGWIAVALACAAVLALIGAAAIWAGEPWLIASLGASALLQTLTPRQPAARPWNTAVGQFIGLGAGFAGVYAVGAAAAPEIAVGEPVTWIRIAAVALAIALTALVQQPLKAQNPAGGATSLLIALGEIAPTPHGAFLVSIGILLVTVIGEAARRAVLHFEADEAGGGAAPPRVRR
jgi:hypothetical protein